jgi:hypothetical protein
VNSIDVLPALLDDIKEIFPWTVKNQNCGTTTFLPENLQELVQTIRGDFVK